jgi:hypothetical protein
MLTLIPISRFRVDYQLASGRPYSEFERLVLHAISGGACTVSELQDIFAVHPRLILEALVTLTHAGWLAVGSAGSGDFLLTSAGRDAIKAGRAPRSRLIEPRYTWIVMERITGALINSNDVRYLSPREVVKFENQALKIKERIFERRLNEAQVDQFVYRAKGEWLHGVTSVDMKSRQAHWVPVTVNLDTGEFDDNLPVTWKPRVGPILLDAARNSALASDARIRSYVGPTLAVHRNASREEQRGAVQYPIFLKSPDIILTDLAHRQYLEEVLRQAESRVLIASAFLRIASLESLRSTIFDCMKRGVTIDVLWGYGVAGSAGSEALEYLKRMSYDARKNGFLGRIRYNKAASGSHAKLIIWDRGVEVEACVGSYNWLSVVPISPTEGTRPNPLPNASVCVRHPALVSRLIRCAMGWWADAQVAALDASPSQWRAIASELQERAESLTGDVIDSVPTAVAELVVDHDHEQILREALTSSNDNLLVASHKLGRIAEVRLTSAVERSRPANFNFQLMYGVSEVDAATLKDITIVVKSAGGVLQHVSGMHAKVVVTDTAICIGSYNFLSADPFGTAKGTRELSISLKGSTVAPLIMSRIRGGQKVGDEYEY